MACIILLVSAVQLCAFAKLPVMLLNVGCRQIAADLWLASYLAARFEPPRCEMEGGQISAQQFEDGARGFAQLWEACSEAEQLWSWVAPGNMLVGQLFTYS